MKITQDDIDKMSTIVTNLMEGKQPKRASRKITQEDIDKMSNAVDRLAFGDDIDELLSNKRDLKHHYTRHVLKENELINSDNKDKYEFMPIEEYKSFAYDIAHMTPTITIDKEIDELEVVEDFVDDFMESNSGSLKIDWGQTNKLTHKQVFYVLNRRSTHKIGWVDFCIVDSATNIPITIFAMRITKLTRYVSTNLGS